MLTELADADLPARDEWLPLIHATRAGDRVAFAKLCSALRTYLSRHGNCQVRVDLRSKFDRSDLVQETLLDAYQDLANFRGTSDREFRAWLAALIRNNAIDYHRRYAPNGSRDPDRETSAAETGPGSEPVDRSVSASCLAIGRETDELLRIEIAKLLPKQRRLLELRHQEQLPFAKIAAELGLSDGAARQLWLRTVNKLRERLPNLDRD